VTAPRPAGRATTPWYARPKIALPIVGALIVLMAINVQQQNIGRSGDPRLTTFSSAPMGGRMFYEMAQRLGWRVEQRKTPDLPADTHAIIAVLDPVVPLRGPEVHALLEYARNGGALLVMFGGGAVLLTDSLRLKAGDYRYRVAHHDSEAQGCAPDKKGLFNRQLLNTLWPGDRVTLNTIESRGPPPDSTTRFVPMDTSPVDHGRPRHAAIGFPYGRGRIVVGIDPDLLRNDAVRICRYGLDVAAVQMLDYLDDPAGQHRRIVFDEYHQGYGEQRGTMAAVGTYLAGTSSGRLLLQLLAAGLVLLLAVAPRLIPPHDPERIERRSPLEHVDALGRAYAQVGATRSATARLVRGVRRRLAGGAARAALDPSDDAFLDRARRDAPQLAESVALIRKALHTRVNRREFASVGAALEQLELSLTRI
jgi:uncharacterized protein DUF4350